MENQKPGTIDEYIAACSPEVQKKLEQIRQVIQETVPEVEETISYAMPTFRFHGNLVHFAAFTNHIGFYPTPNGIERFKDALSRYKGGKGSVQFPLTEELPLDLIREIVRYRLEENQLKAEQKKKTR